MWKKDKLMDAVQKRCLREKGDVIAADLNPKYILPSLLTKHVITANEQQRILDEETREKQTFVLLRILCTKNSESFRYFLQALEEDDVYPWLTEQMKNFVRNNNELEEELYEKLLKGGVPFPLNNLLHRDQKLNDVRDAIYKITNEKRGWIVISGMVGSGKSVLAAEAVRNVKIFKKCFSGGIFWLPIGKLDNNSLLMKMHLLCMTMDPEEHSLPGRTELLTNYIKQLVARNYGQKKKILLILDDVWNKDVIKALDVGCPIIVTTRNVDVLDGISGMQECIKLDAGFNLQETQNLFALYLNTSVTDLPHVEVQKIYDRCKGSPIVIASIGSLMQVHGNKLERWIKYRTELEEGRVGRLRHMSDDKKSLHHAIDISIKSLSEEMQKYYSIFAAFKEDINIPNEVLEVQWHLDKYDVEDIMNDFKKKSLAWMTENIQMNAYIYSIHDLHLDYLKDNCKDKIGLHKNFVNQYLKKCNVNGKYNYGLLPDDKYIHYFLAYHLYTAEQYELLEEIFLDLNFIEKKLKYVGPSDLLNDYQIYKEYFKKTEEKNCFEKFIRNNAHLVNKENVDIIQLALLEPVESVVYMKARDIASERKNPYFQWCNMSSCRNSIMLTTKPHEGVVNCAVFGPNDAIAVSAGEDKIIRIWDCSSGAILQEFHGHCSEINCCVFLDNGQYLLSASADGTLKLWKVFYNLETNSERRHSRGLIVFNFSDESYQTYKGHDDSVLCCCLSSDESKIISGDSNGIGLVWERKTGNILLRLMGHSSSINSCSISPDGKLIATASSDYTVKLWCMISGNCTKTFLHESAPVSSCHFNKKGNYLISNSGQHVWKWHIDNVARPIFKYSRDKPACYITCCALSPDYKHFVGGTSENDVVVWSEGSGKIVACFKAHSDIIKCVSYSSNAAKILSVAADGTLIIWSIDEFVGFSRVSLTKHLSVVFYNNEMTVTVPDENNCIQVLSGVKGKLKYNIEAENRDGDISTCCLSPNCNKVAYGTKIGAVKLCDIESEETIDYPGHNEEVTYSTFFSDSCAFVTCSNDCTLKIWKENEIIECVGHAKGVTYCKPFCEDRKLISCSFDGSIRVWEVTSGTQLLECFGHGNETVTYCDVSSNEQYLASASADCTVILWNAETGNKIAQLSSECCMRSCCFSPNSQFLAAGDDDGKIQIWEVNKNPKTAITLSKHDRWVHKILFSHDSQQLVSVANSIKWWNVNGQLLQTFDMGGEKYHIFSSEDFSTFVTVDTCGILYILKRLET